MDQKGQRIINRVANERERQKMDQGSTPANWPEDTMHIGRYTKIQKNGILTNSDQGKPTGWSINPIGI